MENYDNGAFGFENEMNDEIENSTGFNYDSISGLGESDYENEDLFNSEVEESQNDFRIENNGSGDSSSYYADIPPVESIIPTSKDVKNDSKYYTDITPIESIIPTSKDVKNDSKYYTDITPIESIIPTSKDVKSDSKYYTDITPIESIIPTSKDVVADSSEDIKLESPEVYEFSNEEIEDSSEAAAETIPSENIKEEEESSEDTNKIDFDTKIEDLNKLTEYKDEKIESADISNLFDKVSVNVKDASEIFKRNTDLKKKIDARFEELKKLQSEVEASKKSQKDEIDRYKEEVYNKLTEKKEEIEKRLNMLKEVQTNLEKEKNEFEQYKRKEKENIDRVQKEVQSAYDERRDELNNIEDILRKQKDALDEERNQLSLDKIQYEADKNELANNLLKFNDLVNSFTNGVGNIKE